MATICLNVLGLFACPSFINDHLTTGFEDEKLWSNAAASSESVAAHDDKVPEVVLRRTQSFEADDK